MGRRKQAAAVGIPVSVWTTAEPPICKIAHRAASTGQKHGRYENVCHNAEDEIHDMCNLSSQNFPDREPTFP